MLNSLNKHGVRAAWLAVFLAGLLAGAHGYHSAREARIQNVMRMARGASLIMSIPEVRRLTGTPADEGREALRVVRERFEEIMRQRGRIYDMYIFRRDPAGGGFLCLAGSVEENAPRGLRPGDGLEGLVDCESARRALATGEVVFDRARCDFRGRRVTAYARMGDAHNAMEGYFARLDIDTDGWRLGLFAHGFERMSYAWMLLGGPLVVVWLGRRDTRKKRFIRLLSLAIEQSALAMLILDDKGIVRYVNDSLCALSKYTREELIGRHYLMTEADMPADALAELTQAFKEGRTMSTVMNVEGKGGLRYNAVATVVPIFDKRGKIIASCSMIVDVSEHERQAEAMRRAKEQAEASDKAKSVFISTVSHEVRSPLNIIAGFSNLLEDTALTDAQREYVKSIRASSDMLLRLAENMLDFTRIERGGLKIETVPVDVRAVVANALESQAAAAAAKSLRLIGTIAPEVPQLAEGDPTRLQQVLVNLLDNAVSFTPSGEVEVAVRVRVLAGPPSAAGGEAAAGDRRPAPALLEFTVRDTGIGISQEDQMRLFRPFVQLNPAGAANGKGGGLGLAISYNLVRLMGGGGIGITSERGKGSVFIFSIPCVYIAD